MKCPYCNHELEVKCLRCGNKWTPRVQKPAQCPYCGSARWDTPRTGNEPGPKPKQNKQG